METLARIEKLEAFQASHRLVLSVYRHSRTMPADERYGLVAQMRRAAVSITSNLVEGSMRPGTREYRRFVGIAVGSFNELRYHVRLCEELGYLASDAVADLNAATNEAGRLVWGLYRGLGGVRSPA